MALSVHESLPQSYLFGGSLGGTGGTKAFGAVGATRGLEVSAMRV
jgi:hypothetical protein